MTDPRSFDGRDADDPRREAELRTLLEDAVADVEPAPALDHIRDRIAHEKVTPMTDKRPWILGIVTAAAATAAAVAVVAVLTDNDTRDAAADPAASPSPSVSAPSEPAPEESPTEAPTPDPSDEPTASDQTVPVYYVGTTPTGPRLYREFHRLPTFDPVYDAVAEALRASAEDPDYDTLWDGVGAEPLAVEVGDDQITVSLGGSGLADRPRGMGPAQARLAVQQLVYTATAAAQQDTVVRFALDGRPADTLLGVDVSDGARRAGAERTLAPVWIITPQDGDRVRGTFEVEGQGAFFEANVSWQLLSPDGSVVEEGFTTAEECCRLAPYAFTVRGVEAGDYVLRVYAADESGGEGPGEPEDTKRLTVG